MATVQNRQYLILILTLVGGILLGVELTLLVQALALLMARVCLWLAGP